MSARTKQSQEMVWAANERWLTDAWFHAEVEMAVLITNPPEAFRSTARLAAAVALHLHERDSGAVTEGQEEA